jgi:hypothetical protein
VGLSIFGSPTLLIGWLEKNDMGGAMSGTNDSWLLAGVVITPRGSCSVVSGECITFKNQKLGWSMYDNSEHDGCITRASFIASIGECKWGCQNRQRIVGVHYKNQ